MCLYYRFNICLVKSKSCHASRGLEMFLLFESISFLKILFPFFFSRFTMLDFFHSLQCSHVSLLVVNDPKPNPYNKCRFTHL